LAKAKQPTEASTLRRNEFRVHQLSLRNLEATQDVQFDEGFALVAVVPGENGHVNAVFFRAHPSEAQLEREAKEAEFIAKLDAAAKALNTHPALLTQEDIDAFDAGDLTAPEASEIQDMAEEMAKAMKEVRDDDSD